MVSHRRLKQTLYGLGFLFSSALVLTLIILVVAQPSFETTPTPSPTPQYDDMVVEQVDSVVRSGFIDIVARLRNPNPRVGTGRYVVSFVLFDAQGTEVTRHNETVYILPGSVQYVVAINVPLPRPISRIQVVTPVVSDFMRLPPEKELPTFSSFLREREIRLINNIQLEEQKGIVANTNTLDWERIDVAGVALDRSGKVVGISKTFVGQLHAGEQREFTLQWPVPAIPTERVIIIPSTNIYSPENIVNIIGDPALLR